MTARTPLPDNELDAFEGALLTRLTDTVAEQPAWLAQPTTRRDRRPGRRTTAVRLAAAAAAVAAGAGAYLVSPLGSSPAFAVTTAADGEVTVTVSRLEGAEALEQALAEAGVPADVTFPEQGSQCREGRYAAAPPKSDAILLSAQMTDAGQSLTLPKNALQPGQTLVLESMWRSDSAWALRVGIAQGPVGACVPEPFVAPPGGILTPLPGSPGESNAPAPGGATRGPRGLPHGVPVPGEGGGTGQEESHVVVS